MLLALNDDNNHDNVDDNGNDNWQCWWQPTGTSCSTPTSPASWIASTPRKRRSPTVTQSAPLQSELLTNTQSQDCSGSAFTLWDENASAYIVVAKPLNWSLDLLIFWSLTWRRCRLLASVCFLFRFIPTVKYTCENRLYIISLSGPPLDYSFRNISSLSHLPSRHPRWKIKKQNNFWFSEV